MLVYLTLMMQVQIVNWSPLLMVLGHFLIPPLLRPPWPALLQLQSLLPALPLLTVMCLRLLLYHPLPLVCNLWLICLLISCHMYPRYNRLPLRPYQHTTDIL